MPLYKDHQLSDASRVLVWKVTEMEADLRLSTLLNEKNTLRFNGMKSELHRRAFLSVRELLKLTGYTDHDLYYDDFGKPNLRDGKNISITHSHEFAAIIVSDRPSGIDLEWAREKILRIADKFVSSEMDYLQNEAEHDRILKLTVIWGIKESIFKIRNEAGISFKDHINVPPFVLSEGKANGALQFNGLQASFDVDFIIFEDFVLVWVFGSDTAN